MSDILRTAVAVGEGRESGLAGAVPSDGQGASASCALVVFVLIWALWGAVLLAVRVHHPGMGIGEGWSDADIVNAGRWFDREGYAATGGLPRLDTAPLRAGEVARTYDTFPAGPFWVFQAVKAAGVRDLAAQRAVYQVWTHFGELLLFVVAWRLSGSAWIGALAACLHMLSVPYAAYSSGFWVNVSQPLLFATLYSWLRWERASSSRDRGRWLACATAMAFAGFWLTLEIGPFIAVFVCVRAAMKRSRAAIVAGALLCAAPVGVMVLRVVHHAAATGRGIGGAVAHFIESGEVRAGLGDGASTWSAVGGVWLTRLGWPFVVEAGAGHNRQFAYPALSLAVLIAGAALMGGMASNITDPRMREARRGFWAGALLLLAGASWTLLMRNHVWHHRFTVLTLMPGLAMMLGSLVWSGWAMRPARGSPGRARPLAWMTTAAAIVLMGSMISSLSGSDLLNRAMRLDAIRHSQARALDEHYQIAAQASEKLTAFTRLLVFPKRPMFSVHLRTPFQHAGRDAPVGVPDVAAGEGWWLDTFSREAGELAGRLSADVGFPGVERWPGRFVVFPTPVQGVTLDIRACVEGLGEVDGVRISPTLDGEHLAVIWRIAATSGRNQSASVLDPAMDERFNIGFELIGGDGGVIESVVIKPGLLGTRAAKSAVFWTTVAIERVREAAALRLTVWDVPRRRFATWSVHGTLPGGLRPASGHQWIECDLGATGVHWLARTQAD